MTQATYRNDRIDMQSRRSVTVLAKAMAAGLFSLAISPAVMAAAPVADARIADGAAANTAVPADARAARQSRESPRIYDEAPRDVTIGGQRPHVRARLDSGSVGTDIGRTRILIDGTDVSAHARIAQNHVIWVAPDGFGAGEHLVHVDAADMEGHTNSKEWHFKSAPQPAQAKEKSANQLIHPPTLRTAPSAIAR